MARYLVTVRLPKNPEHNPREKKAGPCPVNAKPCSDVTGEHHTFLVDEAGETVEEIREVYSAWFRVTRVETV
jgi:hypothetical protein